MARNIAVGFEMNTIGGQLELVSTNGGAVTVTTSNPRTGVYCASCSSGGSNLTAYFVPQSCATFAGTIRRWRTYFKVDTLPASTVTIMKPNGASLPRARLTSEGKIQFWDDTVQIGSDSVQTVGINIWYRLEMEFDFTNALGSQRGEVRLDGVSVGSSTTMSVGSVTLPEIGWIEAPGANRVLFLDDIAGNDATGTVNNSWPGEGKIVALLPISDNARDTLWTGGAGGTTNLFDAVNNTPPIGTATETNLTQIEHAGGAAGTTDRYDANMTTYAAAGIASTDIINSIHTLVSDGEDVNTGTKILAYEVLSNPVMASVGSVTAGENAGALGTWPTNWTVRTLGAVVNAEGPSVIVGTSPVFRVRRPETTSRVASVCLMAMMVDYTPVRSPLPPGGHHDVYRRTIHRM